jgi:hypothetical protein
MRKVSVSAGRASRRSAMLAEINRAKADGEFSRDAHGELLIDAIFGAVCYRRLLRTAPLTEEFGDSSSTRCYVECGRAPRFGVSRRKLRGPPLSGS